LSYLYKFIFDTGKVICVSAKTRKRAINKVREEYEISKEFIANHCRILNMGSD
jgi:TATA-box binding protein (TBP) (component of TFIID and TFIIIB)